MLPRDPLAYSRLDIRTEGRPGELEWVGAVVGLSVWGLGLELEQGWAPAHANCDTRLIVVLPVNEGHIKGLKERIRVRKWAEGALVEWR